MDNSFDKIVEKFSIPHDPDKRSPERVCLNCGRKITSSDLGQNICSHKCDVAINRRRIEARAAQKDRDGGGGTKKQKQRKTKNRNKKQRQNNRIVATSGVQGHTDYHEYIKSNEWRQRADAAKVRAGWRCQVCNEKSGKVQLDAHHRTYARLGHELPEDITVLCRDCHELFSKAGKLAKR